MLSWSICNFCNFHCEYCNNGEAKDAAEFQKYNIEILKKSFDTLGRDWIIHISGGEPFLVKDFIPMCEMITTNHFISLNTNLSTSNIFEFADRLNPEKVLFISASVHILEREKTDPSLDKFIEKIEYLQNKDFNIIASYLALPGSIKRIRKDVETLNDRGVKKVRIKSFRGVFNSKLYPFSYSKEEISFLQSLEMDYPEQDILKGNYSFYNHTCAAGQRFFEMDATGNLKRCGALNRHYGNLFAGTNYHDTKPRTCPLRECGCPYEGIRNAHAAKGSFLTLYSEKLQEDFFQLERIINNPKLLFKIKSKIQERFMKRM
jgi:MoaA/NifB/PqqE/SkfB family radical SAM enzyme